MSLKIHVRESGNVVILDLNGRITIGEEGAALRDTIKEHLDSGQKNILLNLAEVSYIDSTGLGQFVGSFATVTSRGGQLKLLNLQKTAAGIDADHQAHHRVRDVYERSGRRPQLRGGSHRVNGSCQEPLTVAAGTYRSRRVSNPRATRPKDPRPSARSGRGPTDVGDDVRDLLVRVAAGRWRVLPDRIVRLRFHIPERTFATRAASWTDRSIAACGVRRGHLHARERIALFQL
jgi:anti-sigma B factor antagonist